MIKHIWFDVSGTLTVDTPAYVQAHNQLRYKTYADTIGRPLTEDVAQEYEEMYGKYGSNSAVFRSLGLPSDYWQKYFNTLDKELYYGPDERVYGTLAKLRDKVPISIFTNVTPDENTRTLKVLGIDSAWFTYIISGDDISERKPALDGFKLMIEKSALLPQELLYVGDRVDVDIKPAKSLNIQTAFVWGQSPEADYSCPNFIELLQLV